MPVRPPVEPAPAGPAPEAAAPPARQELHEWVSFRSPGEERTWVFDVTFLLSAWRCIYGDGCQGVLTAPAPELAHGCCSYGAHLTGPQDVADTTAAAARLTAAQWQHRRKGQRGGFLRTDASGTTTTRLVDGACIFLNRPGWPTGPGCAFHQAALAAGERPLDWKPDVCWQLPFRQVDHVDDHGYVTSTVTEWKRRDWGPGGEEFAWWCTEAPEAFSGAEPVYRAAKDDLVELVGAEVYAMVAAELDARRAARRPVAHPALLAPPSRRRPAGS